MHRHFVSTMIASCCALAFVACKDGGSSSGGAGGGTGGTAGSGGTDEECLTDGSCEDDWPVLPTCMDCACTNKSDDVEPGCADTCDNTISGSASPNFCNGAAALTQCEACIATRCGASSATCE